MTSTLLPRALSPVAEAARGPSWPARVGRWLTAIAVFVAVIELIFGLSAPDFVSGLALGSLYGIIGVGIVLIYRTSRIINFAAGAVGAVPAVIALVLVLEYGVNYLAVLPIVLVGGPVLGLLADVVMHRFDGAPRLIATVMTIAVAQSLAILGFFIPVWLGQNASKQGTTVTTPWQHLVWHTSRGQPLLTGNEIAAFITVAVVTVGLAAFLRLTRLGIALRARRPRTRSGRCSSASRSAESAPSPGRWRACWRRWRSTCRRRSSGRRTTPLWASTLCSMP